MLPDARGISEPAKALGLETPSDFVRAYPMFREWLALLIRRMDAKASIYRSASSLSPHIKWPRSHMEFHSRGLFDATITLQDAADSAECAGGLALRRRSLYDRLKWIRTRHLGRGQSTAISNRSWLGLNNDTPFAVLNQSCAWG